MADVDVSDEIDPVDVPDDWAPTPPPGEPGGTPAEQRAADEIDAIVDRELKLPRHSIPYETCAKCGECGREWHGLAHVGGCAGASTVFAQQYKRKRRKKIFRSAG